METEGAPTFVLPDHVVTSVLVRMSPTPDCALQVSRIIYENIFVENSGYLKVFILFFCLLNALLVKTILCEILFFALQNILTSLYLVWFRVKNFFFFLCIHFAYCLVDLIRTLTRT